MSNSAFDHPAKQAIQCYLTVQDRKFNPLPVTTFLPEFLGFSAYYTALFMSFFYVVNPYGSATRLRRERTLNPVWRYSRKLIPFGILISGVGFFDKVCGLYD